eukprot:jgi/Ulvmu1/5612/UM023_0150.1
MADTLEIACSSQILCQDRPQNVVLEVDVGAADPDPAAVSRGMNVLYITSGDGHQCAIPFAVVALSHCLQTLADRAGSWCRIPLPFAWLRAWLAFVTNTHSANSTVRQLLQVVQVADFLADARTVTAGCGRIGLYLLTGSHQPCTTKGSGNSCQYLRDPHMLVEVLESIPPHLALLVLRRVFTPPRIRSEAGSHSVAMQLAHLLPCLPLSLQPLAIRAYDPAVDQHSALAIRDTSAASAATIVAAASSSALHLTAVLLQNITSTSPRQGPPHMHACSDDALDSILTGLANLPALSSLTLSGVVAARPCSLTCWSALLHLSALTHFEASCCVAAAAVLSSVKGKLV